MLDGESLKAIAVGVAAAYTAIVKVVDLRKSKKAKEGASEAVKHEVDLYSDFNTRMEEFEEIIELPEEGEISPEVRDLILERNYYRVTAQYFKAKCREMEQVIKHSHPGGAMLPQKVKITHEDTVTITQVGNDSRGSDSSGGGIQPDPPDYP